MNEMEIRTDTGIELLETIAGTLFLAFMGFAGML